MNLVQHDPAWADLARREGDRLIASVGDAVLVVHHIGSTAIPDIRAKPILDLIPVVRSLAAFDNSRQAVERLGYAWWGEYGLPGRRYCTFDDPRTGQRTVQLHCFEQGSPQVTRHLVFRDHLRSHPDLAHEYDVEKARCRDCHPCDSHAYSDCKEAWIRRVEAQALSARNQNKRT
ncbi:MAG TPA: GrpB family protein [Rhizomicrobium sp.]|nr:GrpB family protein [Rhizomicrobium sp.]